MHGTDRKATVIKETKKHSLQLRKKHQNIEADGLHQQKTTLGTTTGTEASVCTGSLKLDNKSLEKC